MADMIKSKINPDITLEYLTTQKENLHFDRKSAGKAPKEIAKFIAGFANSDGGTLALGISDDGVLEGFEQYQKHFDEYNSIAFILFKVQPLLKLETIQITNVNNRPDKILLIHIEKSIYEIIRTSDDAVYVRQGDKTPKLTEEQIQVLKQDKIETPFEDNPVTTTTVSDIDLNMIKIYQEKTNAIEKDPLDVLRKRKFLVTRNGKEYLTIAGVLLFAEDPTTDFPCSKVKVTKFEGLKPETGERLNIVKEEIFCLPLYKQIQEVNKFINSQLRDFITLTTEGDFKKVPEYPPFAWIEGITNAVTHRNYAMSGDYIKVLIFDDRMEIISPGNLPGNITLENIKKQRHSRNPKIATTLSYLGLVREYNEGVPRIFEEMKNFYLDDPIYSIEENAYVKLILKNNYIIRNRRKTEKLSKFVPNEIWNTLSSLDKTILMLISDYGQIGTKVIIETVGRARSTVITSLNRLIKYDIIEDISTSINDPKKIYKLKIH